MIHRIYREWRKVFTLSATFILAAIIVFSCKKKDTTVGSSGIDVAGLLAAGAVDTFTLETYSVLDDSIMTKNPLNHTIGEMYDPVFGTIKTSFYTQIRLESGNPVFGPLSDIIMDSVVLSLQFSYYTGKLTTQNFEVYELAEEISSEDDYYSSDSITRVVPHKNLVEAGSGMITPEPIADAVIDSVSVAPQLRIRLDTSFAKTIIAEANNNPSSFTDNDNFQDYFKGLYVTTNNSSFSPGDGGVFGLNMSATASKLTMYFKRWETVSGVLTLVRKEFNFIIDGSTESFNRADFNRSGTDIQKVIDDKANGLKQFYAQAFGLRAVVNIPGLSNLPKTAIVHKAVLSLPIQYQSGSVYSPGTTVTLATKQYEGGNVFQFVGDNFRTTPISNFSKSITQDIASYAQDVASGIRVNKPIYITASRSVRSGDRIVFNGTNTLNKVKPKLYIIYTEF